MDLMTSLLLSDLLGKDTWLWLMLIAIVMTPPFLALVLVSIGGKVLSGVAYPLCRTRVGEPAAPGST